MPPPERDALKYPDRNLENPEIPFSIPNAHERPVSNGRGVSLSIAALFTFTRN
jgi:hypothetical protein